MKKFLVVISLALLPSSAFAILGFGFQAGQDLAKLDSYSYTEGEGLAAVTVNSYAMESSPKSFGAYAFVNNTWKSKSSDSLESFSLLILFPIGIPRINSMNIPNWRALLTTRPQLSKWSNQQY